MEPNPYPLPSTSYHLDAVPFISPGALLGRTKQNTILPLVLGAHVCDRDSGSLGSCETLRGDRRVTFTFPFSEVRKSFIESVYSWLDARTSLLNQQKHHKNPYPGCVLEISPGGCVLVWGLLTLI